MKHLKSCGVLLFRNTSRLSFLLLRHPNRYDLPKGHIQEGESEVDCALRELREETGIQSQQLRLEAGFRYTTTYRTRYRRFDGEEVEKTLVVFLAHLEAEAEVIPHEHGAFVWMEWAPPHQIQTETIDPLLAQAATFLAN